LVDARPDPSFGRLADVATGSEIEPPIEVYRAPGAKNFGDAVREALREAEEVATEWLWLLHDDSPPAPEALAELLKATASSRAVGIAGCKQVDFTDSTRLLSVGV